MSDHSPAEVLAAYRKLDDQPELKATWHKTIELQRIRAWKMLRNSGELPPEFPLNLIKHNPWLRFWESPSGWAEYGPWSLTVFLGRNRECLARRAEWNQRGDFHRAVEFVEGSDEIEFDMPTIHVRDADVAAEKVESLLRVVYNCSVPAIPLRDLDHMSVACDVGFGGFDYMTRDQPPAGVSVQWSHETPSMWDDALNKLRDLREYLERFFE